MRAMNHLTRAAFIGLLVQLACAAVFDRCGIPRAVSVVVLNSEPRSPTFYRLTRPQHVTDAAVTPDAGLPVVEGQDLEGRLKEPEPIAERFAARSPAVANRLFREKCIICHNAIDARGGVNLELEFSSLTRYVRQEAVLRMLSTDPAERMPKGQPPLARSEFLILFRELVQ
jgi:hypothetical protein